MTAVRVHFPDGTMRVGRVLDLRDAPVSADALVRSIRFGLPVRADAPRVVCPDPTPVHRFCARLAPGAAFDRRGALAALARSRGHEAPEANRLERARTDLAEATPPDPEDLAAARRRAAEAGAETDRLRERAATIRGRVEAARDADRASDAESELAETMRELSEAATERVAARQRLDVLEAKSRAARDRREARMRLEDRVANLERSARRSLADRVYDEFADAVATLPDAFEAAAGADPGECEGAPVAAGLAVARAASLRAPVVVDGAIAEDFGGVAPLARFLGAPVVVR